MSKIKKVLVAIVMLLAIVLFCCLCFHSDEINVDTDKINQNIIKFGKIENIDFDIDHDEDSDNCGLY